MIIKTNVRSGPGLNPLTIRKFHTYIGVLIAPSMLFFSATGAYQLFGLHEGHPGEAYQPPALLMQLSAVHKDQVFAAKHHGPPAGAKPAAAGDHDDGPHAGDKDGGDKDGGDHDRAGTLLLKWYFLVVALGMFGTTLLGQYLAFKYARAKRTIWGLTLVGTVVPILLLLV